MRFGLCAVACLFLSSVISLAQTRGVPHGRVSLDLSTPDIRMGAPASIQPSGTFFLSGRVAIDDGAALTDRAAIQTVCRGQRRTEAYTDREGYFSFELGKPNTAIGEDPENTSALNPARRLNRNLHDCELQAILPGFTSPVVELVRFDGNEATDVGTIMLHRLAQVEGFTISATTAAAPSNARKDYEKGRKLEARQKWDDAQAKFEKAVQAYPRFAIAWLELGRVQEQKKDNAAARASFAKALQSDSKLIGPYEELVHIALQEKNWSQAAQNSDRLLSLNPVSFPQDWFYSSLANYFLQKFDVAEKSAREGMKIDTDHRIPSLEYLLGLSLVQRHNDSEALEHLRNFVRVSPNSLLVQTVNRQIAALEERLQTAVGLAKQASLAPSR